MRIAEVSPLFESVPPRLYGGTERVVSFLAEELVRQGHEVTLFASADSSTSAQLVPCAPRALRLDESSKDHLAHHVRMVEEVCRRSRQFDIIHFHLDYLHLPTAARCATPYVTTQHGRLDIPDLAPLFRTYPDAPMVSISDAQRAPVPFVSFVATIYHGLPRDLLAFHPEAGTYLAFLGRISPEKGADRAIEIAARVGMPLKIAAKLDTRTDRDRDYWEQTVRPLLRRHPNVEFVGEVNERQKDAFLGAAAALLFPIDWPEPFGLAMVEAMACGTPVLAFRRGSVPEIMEDGVSGVVVDDVEQAVAAMERLLALPRAGCRAAFERRFLAERMAADYVRLFHELAADGATARAPSGRGGGLHARTVGELAELAEIDGHGNAAGAGGAAGILNVALDDDGVSRP